MGWEEIECYLCGAKSHQQSLDQLDLLHLVSCCACGEYEITDDSVLSEPKTHHQEKVCFLSAVTRQYYENGARFRVDDDMLTDKLKYQERVLSLVPSNVQGKLDSLLRYIHKKSERPGVKVDIYLGNDFPIAFCRDSSELQVYMNHLDKAGLINIDLSQSGEASIPFILVGYNIRMPTELTIEGWQKIEEMNKPNLESTQAFVAMWFDEKLYSAFAEGIKKLEDDTGFTMLRIDMKQHNEKICDRILVEIRKSRFLIADVTGHRQGVYFEAGYAMGLGLPVIWTCRKEELKNCHFDTRQYSHIAWKTPEELREKLKNRILATIQ